RNRLDRLGARRPAVARRGAALARRRLHRTAAGSAGATPAAAGRVTKAKVTKAKLRGWRRERARAMGARRRERAAEWGAVASVPVRAAASAAARPGRSSRAP